MSTYKNGIETKKKLIQCVCSAFENGTVSDLKIRDIAKQAGCAPSSVYQHFENMDKLIAVASVCFLDTYTLEYSQMLNRVKNIKDSYLTGWDIFCKHAFARPDIYYKLFWEYSDEVFEEAVTEYYEIFPLTPPEELPAQYYLTFLSGNVVERDYVYLRSMASQGIISIEDAHYMSIVSTSIARNYLGNCILRPDTNREKAKEDCMKAIRTTLKLVMDNYQSSGKR
ncbi:MAG: TetR/AcrR family transcriptional regulator [Lachnospiraceae bacterium]|nr:TetR/AcrR family transcriptional regulator [Lachnospiraceae bacterium]